MFMNSPIMYKICIYKMKSYSLWIVSYKPNYKIIVNV